MGKGDKKSRRGKISQGSYGKKRSKRKNSVAAIPVRVLDQNDNIADVKEVNKKLPEQTNTTENANVEEKVVEKTKTTRKKKTED